MSDSELLAKKHAMAFVNNYVQAPEPVILENELYGPEPYDVNFVFPIPLELSTNKLRLIPFIPRVHAAAYFDGIRGHKSMFKYLSLALEYPADLLRFVERHRRNENEIMFAAIDTTRPDSTHPEWEGALAGFFRALGNRQNEPCRTNRTRNRSSYLPTDPCRLSCCRFTVEIYP